MQPKLQKSRSSVQASTDNLSSKRLCRTAKNAKTHKIFLRYISTMIEPRGAGTIRNKYPREPCRRPGTSNLHFARAHSFSYVTSGSRAETSREHALHTLTRITALQSHKTRTTGSFSSSVFPFITRKTSVAAFATSLIRNDTIFNFSDNLIQFSCSYQPVPGP